MTGMGHEHELGVATVELESRRRTLQAALLLAGRAFAAGAAAPAAEDDGRVVEVKARPAKEATGLGSHGVHPAGDLVAQRQRPGDAEPIRPGQVQVGVAHTAAGDAEAHLGAGRFGNRQLLEPQRFAGDVGADGEHGGACL